MALCTEGESAHVIASLCAGYGGLCHGAKRAIEKMGGAARVGLYIEREAYAVASLVSQIEKGLLDDAPIFSDVATFDYGSFRGRFSGICAGFPCQPLSVAGKRLGDKDERWLWPYIAHAIGELKPRWVFLENVPGLITSGLISHIARDLSGFGYRFAWAPFRASEAGAPHRRERVFILADTDHRDTAERKEIRPRGRPAFHGRRDVADTDGAGLQRRGEPIRKDQDKSPFRPRRPEMESPVKGGHRFPPGPKDEAGWREYIKKGGALPAICRSHDGARFRSDRLRLLGNGVVPQQAERAFLELSKILNQYNPKELSR